MLFLTNEHVQQVLDMAGAIEAMEDAYRELVAHHAAYRPRIDFYVPQEPHYYRWGTMEGASRERGIFAIRMKSDMLVWNTEGEFPTEEKYCVEPGTYCGLIFLLSTRNGEPLAILNDGILQHIRVGACAGLGAKYLAREDSRELGVLGSGGMARTYAEAIAQVRPIGKIRVFSPTKKNRDRYAAEVSDQLGIEVVAVDDPQTAVRGADIVSVTTDSLKPAIDAAWLEPGMHVTNVRGPEIGPDIKERADVVAKLGASTLDLETLSDDMIVGGDGMTSYFAGTREEADRIPRARRRALEESAGTIPDLIAGLWEGRTSPDQITFMNNAGTQGLQFAAVGGLTLERAVKAGLGHELPREWFLQNIRD
jgi:ornithine cyclodeaminase/alanine dehydrogenase-like protein (mu-crystallin family)